MKKTVFVSISVLLIPAAPAWANAGTGGASGILFSLLVMVAVFIATKSAGGYRIIKARQGAGRGTVENALGCGCFLWIALAFVLSMGMGMAGLFGLSVIFSIFFLLLALSRGVALIQWSKELRQAASMDRSPSDDAGTESGEPETARIFPENIKPGRLKSSGIGLIVIVLFFAALAAPMLALEMIPTSVYRDRARQAAVRSELKNLNTAQEAFFMDHDRYARNMEELSEIYVPVDNVIIRIERSDKDSWQASGRHETASFTLLAGRGEDGLFEIVALPEETR